MIKKCINSYHSIARINFNNLRIILNEWKFNLPQVKPYYAIKSYPNKDLIKFLATNELDIGFDCASKTEIKKVESYKKDIILANPMRSIDDILYAKKSNIKKIVIDSVEEVEILKKVYPECGIIIRTLSDELFSQIKFNKKFGANEEGIREILYLIKLYRLNHLGYSFHVGSKCYNVSAYINTINNILEINGKHPKIIDIGGGFDRILLLVDLGEELKRMNLKSNMIAEPGRLFSNNILDIYCKITNVKRRIIDGNEVLYITINDSVYHSFNGKIFDGQTFDPLPLYNENENIRCLIFGQTCDSLDLIADKVLPKPRINDVLLFKNVGSYSLASSNGKFNGFTSCKLI